MEDEFKVGDTVRFTDSAKRDFGGFPDATATIVSLNDKGHGAVLAELSDSLGTKMGENNGSMLAYLELTDPILDISKV